MLKKILLGLTVCSLLAFTFSTVKADDSLDHGFGYKYDSTKTSAYSPTEVKEQNILGTKHQVVKANTVTKGFANGQNINLFEMKTDGVTSKLVTWAVQAGNADYKRATITEAARNFEKNNPGWLVTGGINADQYFFKDGNRLGVDGSSYFAPSPYYPMISGGNFLFPTSPYGGYSNIAGIKNDGSASSLTFETGGAGNFYLEIIDTLGNTIEEFVVDAINTKATGNQITVWSTYVNQKTLVRDPLPVSSTSDMYKVEDAEIAFMNNSVEYTYDVNGRIIPGFNSFFGRGKISQITKDTTVAKGQFVIETTNAAVTAKLKEGTRVRVSQRFKNADMNACEEGIGFHTRHIKDGVEQQSKSSYNLKNYSRSLFGKKADGTYVLITADMVDFYKYRGLNLTETNAVGAFYGLTDMVQMDGGGSVTAMVREGNDFKVTNVPKDSGNPNNPRANLSYLFFVVRDSGIKVNTNATTFYSITLNKTQPLDGTLIKNVKIELSDKSYDFKEDTLTIDGLKDNTSYNLKVKFDCEIDGSLKHLEQTITCKTNEFIPPKSVFEISNIGKTGFVVTKKDIPEKDNIKNVIVHVGDSSFQMGDNTTVNVTDLISETTYEVYYEYDIFSSKSNTTYHINTESFKMTTSAFDLPEIIKFETRTVKDQEFIFSYQYRDTDKVSVKAYISINDVKYELDSKIGSLKVTDVDRTTSSYEAILVIEYKDNDSTFKVTSETITIDKVEKQPVEETKPEKSGCGKNDAFTAIISVITLACISAYVIKKR